MTLRESYIVLNLLPGIGSVRLKQLLQHYDSPQAVLKEKASVLATIKGIGPKLADLIAKWERHADLGKELETATRAGVQICTLIDPEYPSLLQSIYDPPLCLYVRGNVRSLNGSLPIAIVGSRRTTRYGIETTERLTTAAVNAGFTIISGLARGIDTVAHTATVEHDGVTVAVLGGGLGYIYPQENVPLARKIVEKGALVSEFPMSSRPDRRSFPMRNRIIAGLCKGTLVAEAGSHSGALITAQQALDHGRLVFAVPGRVDSPLSRGCHYLIKDGAKLVESIEDVLDEFDLTQTVSESLPLGLNGESTESNGMTLLQLSDSERIIMKLLEEGEMSVDEISQRVQSPVHNLLSLLLGLEIRRLIVQLPGKRFCLNRKR